LKTKEIVRVVRVLLNLKRIFKRVYIKGGEKTLTTLTFESRSKDSALATVATKLCPLRFPGNTALSQQFQFLIWSGLEPFSGQAVDAGLVKTAGLAGNLRGQTRYLILSESSLPSTAKRMGFLRRGAPSPSAPY